MEYLFTFLLAVTVSFIASIPIGAVNMAVFQATINHNRLAGYSIGLGAVIAEMIYCGIPLFGLSYLLEDSGFYDVMYLLFIPILIFLGVYSIAQRHKGIPQASDETPVRRTYWGYGIYGFLLCASNPMTLLFWTQITVYLRKEAWLPEEPNPLLLVAFLIGVPLGTFILYTLFVIAGKKTKARMNPALHARINVVIGIIFLGLAAYLGIGYANMS